MITWMHSQNEMHTMPVRCFISADNAGLCHDLYVACTATGPWCNCGVLPSSIRVSFFYVDQRTRINMASDSQKKIWRKLTGREELERVRTLCVFICLISVLIFTKISLIFQ